MTRPDRLETYEASRAERPANRVPNKHPRKIEEAPGQLVRSARAGTRLRNAACARFGRSRSRVKLGVAVSNWIVAGAEDASVPAPATE